MIDELTPKEQALKDSVARLLDAALLLAEHIHPAGIPVEVFNRTVHAIRTIEEENSFLRIFLLD